ncbi:tyrosine-type recombinase/integrase [Taibaiella chishuiensis]|nr:tyrosine-type recombinase/integrase [Taibaiella chishuiensis]
MVFAEIIPEFLRYIRFEKRMSDHTFLAYQNDLTSFFTFLESQYELTGIGEVKHTHIRSWLAGLKEAQCSERTLQRKISAVKSLYKYLLRTGAVTVNPTRLVLTPKAPARLPVFLEEQQTELIGGGATAFAEGFEGVTEYLILELLYQTGMRRAELVQLKEADVEYSRQQIRVLGKRNKERMVPAGDALLAELKAYTELKRKNFNQAEPFLLCLKTGKRLYAQYVYRVVQKHLKGVTTLTKKSPHVLRHTFATHMLNNGAELNAIKEMLGHSSLAATQVYTHNNIERLKEVYRKAHPKS